MLDEDFKPLRTPTYAVLVEQNVISTEEAHRKAGDKARFLPAENSVG